MEHEGLLPHSQNPTTCSFCETYQASQRPHQLTS